MMITVYLEGENAYYDDVPLDNNPYPKGTQEHDYWHDGWRDAQYDEDESEYEEYLHWLDT